MRKQFLLAYALALALLLWSLLGDNFEFLFYGLTTLVLVGLLHRLDGRFGFDGRVLWGFDLWILLHILGGLLPVGGEVLYSLVLVDIVAEPYSILKYDQVVHVWCYFIAALLLWQVLAACLATASFTAAALIAVLAAGGVGGINEIIEFLATVLIPETNVGGYENTVIDIIANFAGAVLAVPFFKSLKRQAVCKETPRRPWRD